MPSRPGAGERSQGECRDRGYRSDRDGRPSGCGSAQRARGAGARGCPRSRLCRAACWRRGGAGDLADPGSLKPHLQAVESVFLVWPFTSADVARGVVEVLARHVPRIVYLSAQAAAGRPDSFWATVERLIEASGAAWTFLRPTGFADNTLMWADQIRNGDVVRWPYGAAARALIHERATAAVAVRALARDPPARRGTRPRGTAANRPAELARRTA